MSTQVSTTVNANIPSSPSSPVANVPSQGSQQAAPAQSQSQGQQQTPQVNFDNPVEVGNLFSNLLPQGQNQQQGQDQQGQVQGQQNQQQQEGQQQQQQETPLTEEQINQLLQNDPLLAQVSYLQKELGYTQEEAYNQVYGTQQQDVQPQEQDVQQQNDPYVHLMQNPVEVQNIRRLASAPQPEDVHKFFQASLGVEIPVILDAEGKPDERINNFINGIATLATQLTYKHHDRELTDRVNTVSKKQEQWTSFQSKLDNKFYTDFPELKSEDIASKQLRAHFSRSMQGKLSRLGAQAQKNPEILERAFNATLKEYKSLYPHLRNRLGLQAVNVQQQAAPGVVPNPQQSLQNFQRQQMENPNQSQGNAGNVALSLNNLDNPQEVGNVMFNLLNKK